jgi:general secretion pathway protein A
VLVVDEAQAIESVKAFEELRLLTNFQLNDRFLLTVVLIGQPELRHRIASIPQLDQRIAVRAHLDPFTAEETTSYITHAWDPRPSTDVFTKDAVDVIHDSPWASVGSSMPSVINVLCRSDRGFTD